MFPNLLQFGFAKLDTQKSEKFIMTILVAFWSTEIVVYLIFYVINHFISFITIIIGTTQ